VQVAGAFVFPASVIRAAVPAALRIGTMQQQLSPRKASTLLWTAPGDEADGNDEEVDSVGFSVSKKKRDGLSTPSGGESTDAEDRAAMQRNQRQAKQASKMMASGASAEQLSAYTGIKLVDLEQGFVPKLQETPSHMFVDRDEEGTLKQARFVYVDEYTCIGCTNCAMVAPATFYMDDEHGRARVFQQWKDRPKTIQTAIETCPVDCIHYVPFEELERLENERPGIKINYKARLVGSDTNSADLGMQDISGNNDLRCNNCPSRGCANCPMWSVGENPEYKRKQDEIAKKRQRRRAAKEGQSGGNTGGGGSAGRRRVDL
jgi:ferredoxin